jgi:hypothetical protein
MPSILAANAAMIRKDPTTCQTVESLITPAITAMQPTSVADGDSVPANISLSVTLFRSTFVNILLQRYK